MDRKPDFPYDWIKSGEFRYCQCGYVLLPPKTLICAKCKYRPKLEDHICYCGRTASMCFVHGFRCELHAFQKEPSETAITDKTIITMGRVKSIKPNCYKEITECEQTHRELEAERNKLADDRYKSGVKPLFWLADEDILSKN
jgi:hypothetical protein